MYMDIIVTIVNADIEDVIVAEAKTVTQNLAATKKKTILTLRSLSRQH